MEFFDHSKEKVNKSEIQKVQRVQSEYKKVATWRRQPGHTVFSFNTSSKELKRADMANVAEIDMKQNVVYRRRINVEKDCIYIEALNMKNAIRCLRKEGYLI